jgi:superfamily II DNA or RNA helicase
LISQGYLVKTRVYAPVDPDLRGVRTQAGDYLETQLADHMDRPSLIGDIVTHWLRFGEQRKTVCFAVNVPHAMHIRDEFIRADVRAEHIDGRTPKPDRDAILARLASGELDVVVNCMVLTEGWDMPEVGCCILARPTKKMGLYRQMVGRILRPAENKTDAIVLDHSGAVFRHGFVEDRVEWTLHPDRRAESPTHNARPRETGSRLLECSNCQAIRVAGEACASCGFHPKRSPRDVAFGEGELGLVRGGRARAKEYSVADRERWHGMLTAIALERRYKPGWAWHKYRDKFGDWPLTRTVAPIEPSPEVRSWVRSRDIAWAKKRQAAA